MGRLERAVGEVADDPDRGDGPPDGVAAGRARARIASRFAGGRGGIAPGADVIAPPSSSTRAAASRRGGRRWRASAGRRASPGWPRTRSRRRGCARRWSPRHVRRPRGIQRATEDPRRNPAMTRAVARILVEPRVLPALDQQRLDPGRRRVACPGRACRGRQPLHVARWHDRVELPVGEQDRSVVLGDRRAALMSVDPVAARPDVDPRRQPGQG